MVFAGLYPSESDDYEALRDAVGKLKLNDAAFSYMPETSTAMGFGFRCGFLGLLHMDIVQERLEREYDLDLIITAPSVVYKIILNGPDREERLIDTPAKLPDPSTFCEIQEPYVSAHQRHFLLCITQTQTPNSLHPTQVRLEMMTPTEYTGALMDLGQTRRGIFIEMKYLTPERSTLIYEVCTSRIPPLAVQYAPEKSGTETALTEASRSCHPSEPHLTS